MPNKLKYTEKLANKIAALIETGEHTINEICSLSGITRKTYFKWQRERLHFALLIAIAKQKEADKRVSEALRSLLKLIQGSEHVVTRVRDWKLRNGIERTMITVSTYHIPPNTRAIRFLLENMDKKNFKTRACRFVAIMNKLKQK